MRRLLGGFELDRPLPVRPRYTYAFVTAESAERPKPKLYRDCRGLGSGSWDQLTLRLLTDLNRNAVDQYKGFAAYAGVIGHHGRAIALPADSKGGKRTLTAGCVQTGFDYVSDESLCIDIDTGRIVPYLKPITVSSESCDLLGLDGPTESHNGYERPLVAADLGGSVAQGMLDLGDVMFAEYGHDEMTLTPLPPSEAVAGLLRLSFNHHKNPADSYRVVTQLARQVSTWRLNYHDPLEAAELLRRELG